MGIIYFIQGGLKKLNSYRIYYTLEIHYDRIVAGCQQLLKQNPSTILEEMLMDCQQILKSESDTPKPIVPNVRSGEIAFATGLVMQHKRYNYSCVIFGWDKVSDTFYFP